MSIPIRTRARFGCEVQHARWRALSSDEVMSVCRRIARHIPILLLSLSSLSLSQLWVREVLRVSREVTRCESLLAHLDSLCAVDWSNDEFQSAIVMRVLHDPQQADFPPNQFESAYFWRDLIARIRTRSNGAPLHAQLAEKEVAVLALIATSASEDMTAGWNRSFEVADVCDETTTSRMNGRTESVVVLPTCAPDRTRCYPFRVETGCMAASIGLVMWPAGFLLCEFALDHPRLFAGKRVLELGAGIGLTSVFVAKHTRPSAVIATDFDVRALRNIDHNFKINELMSSDDEFIAPDESEDAPPSSDAPTYTSSGVAHLTDLTAASGVGAPSTETACEMHTARVDWYDYSQSQIAAFEADVIIACDTTYIAEILVPFAHVVHACLKANPRATVFLAQAERHPSTFMLYMDALRDEGLTLTELPTGDLHQRFNYDRITCPVALHQVSL